MQEDKTPRILDEGYLLESANDSARHFRNVYVAYLIVMTYIFITILSTDQELLFRADNKQLPLIHISVPIVAFFTWMPWVLLVVHFYLLIQAVFLSEKVRLYKEALNNHLESSADINKAKKLLVSVPLIHILVEEKPKWENLWLLYAMVLFSLIIFPLAALIGAQITFLPYQSGLITWLHRVVITIDILILWYFWHRIFGYHKGKMQTLLKRGVSGFTLLVLVFVLALIDLPGNNYASNAFYKLEWVNKIMPNYFDLPKYTLVKKEPAPELLARNDDETIQPGGLTWCRYAVPFDLKNRNFRGAQLQEAILCKTVLRDSDLTSANLTSAKLGNANFATANLTSAQFENADLTFAQFQNTDLTSAQFQNADLTSAQFQNADLTFAQFQNADLTFAQFQNADLTSANLTFAKLGDANFVTANLRDANLISADLQNTNLTSADLQNANLTSANLRGADLTAVNLSKTNFSSAVLSSVTLSHTWIWLGPDNFPKGVPSKRRTKLKPEYLCPSGFDLADNKDNKKEYQADRLKKIIKAIEDSCERRSP